MDDRDGDRRDGRGIRLPLGTPAPYSGRRQAAAEVVAAAALHLINQWAAWQALNACALMAERTEEATNQAMHDVAQMQRDPHAQHEALAAFELLDAAVRVWAPEAHPTLSLLTPHAPRP